MLELKSIVNGFFKFAETNGVEIYNEFSLQQMYLFAKDIKFMEELVDRGFNRAVCIVLVSDRPF